MDRESYSHFLDPKRAIRGPRVNSIKEATRNLVVKYKGDLEMDLENEII